MLKVAVVDSGVNAAHSHVGRVAGGVSFVSDNWNDTIGHGTAVAAAILDFEPQLELFAVKIFDQSFATGIERVAQALDWCADNAMDVVNLSLGTAKFAHRDALDGPSRRLNILVAPMEFVGLPAYPGSFPWAFGVSASPLCPRSEVRRGERGGFIASPFPRSLPGLSGNENFNGTSFAVANFTGWLCRLMWNEGLRDAGPLRQWLERHVEAGCGEAG